MVIVPVLSYFFFSKKIHRSVWPSVLLCLIGGLFLSELNNIRVRFGDTLVIIGAFFWAFHIILISKFLKIFNYPITIATFQCLTASIISFIPAFTFEYISLVEQPKFGLITKTFLLYTFEIILIEPFDFNIKFVQYIHNITSETTKFHISSIFF